MSGKEKCCKCDNDAVIRVRDTIVLYEEHIEDPIRIVPDGEFRPFCRAHKQPSKTTAALIFDIEHSEVTGFKIPTTILKAVFGEERKGGKHT